MTVDSFDLDIVGATLRIDGPGGRSAIAEYVIGGTHPIWGEGAGMLSFDTPAQVDAFHDMMAMGEAAVIIDESGGELIRHSLRGAGETIAMVMACEF